MSQPLPETTESLRRIWRRRWRRPFWLGVATLIVGLQAWAWLIEPGRLVQRDYVLRLPNWSRACDGLRVDVLADIHTGSPRNGVDNLDRIVRTVARGDADAVLLAGDYVIYRVFLGTYIAPDVVARHLAPLARAKPVYAVLGNHDWWKGGDDMRQVLEAAGITVLENEATLARLGHCRVWIAGIGDLWEGAPDIGAAYAGVPPGESVIALTHNPDLFPQIPTRTALTVAGHTHGGQIRLPLFGRPVVPIESRRYAAGHVIEGGRQLFVSTGIGTSIVPVRLGVPPEISRLTLRTMLTEPAGQVE